MPIQYDLSAALPRSDVVAVIVVVASFSMKMIFMENTTNASEQKITEKTEKSEARQRRRLDYLVYVCTKVCVRVCGV